MMEWSNDTANVESLADSQVVLTLYIQCTCTTSVLMPLRIITGTFLILILKQNTSIKIKFGNYRSKTVRFIPCTNAKYGRLFSKHQSLYIRPSN